MLQLRACSLPPQSLPRTEPELSSVAVSPPLRKPLVCHHERDRDHGLAERERARGTRWRKGKATTRRPLPAPDTSHHRPSTHPAGLAPRRDGGALCPTVYSSETSLRSCPSRLVDGALIFTLVFFFFSFHSRHEATSIRQHTPVPRQHTQHTCAMRGVRCDERGHVSLSLSSALLCATCTYMCTATADTTLPAETSVAAVSALSLSSHASHTHTYTVTSHELSQPDPESRTGRTLRAHTSQTPGGGDGGGGATRLAEHVAAARGQQRASQH